MRIKNELDDLWNGMYCDIDFVYLRDHDSAVLESGLVDS